MVFSIECICMHLDDYKRITQAHCLRMGSDMYRTLADAKEACSNQTRCFGVENPTCDNFSSRLCLAAFYHIDTKSYPVNDWASLG